MLEEVEVRYEESTTMYEVSAEKRPEAVIEPGAEEAGTSGGREKGGGRVVSHALRKGKAEEAEGRWAHQG